MLYGNLFYGNSISYGILLNFLEVCFENCSNYIKISMQRWCLVFSLAIIWFQFLHLLCWSQKIKETTCFSCKNCVFVSLLLKWPVCCCWVMKVLKDSHQQNKKVFCVWSVFSYLIGKRRLPIRRTHWSEFSVRKSKTISGKGHFGMEVTPTLY